MGGDGARPRFRTGLLSLTSLGERDRVSVIGDFERLESRGELCFISRRGDNLPEGDRALSL